MKKILTIDDSKLTRNVIKNILGAHGFSVMEAANGREGLEMVESANPDIILLDLLMPEVNGFEVLESLNDMDNTIPVVVLTADIQKTTRKKCLDLGADFVIRKPPKEDELMTTIMLIQSNGGTE